MTSHRECDNHDGRRTTDASAIKSETVDGSCMAGSGSRNLRVGIRLEVPAGQRNRHPADRVRTILVEADPPGGGTVLQRIRAASPRARRHVEVVRKEHSG